MTDECEEKCMRLKEYMRNLGRAGVAFSGGVDSAFLLKTAHDVLGDDCIAFTASSCFIPEAEMKSAGEFCRSQHIIHVVLDVEPLAIKGVASNSRERCYLCKKAIFSEIFSAARARGIRYIIEGTNSDDMGDFRPGLLALRELGVKSPLLECGFTKDDVRAATKELLLPEWNKPSAACLASRFVYGEPLTEEKVRRVGQAEDFLHGRGFSQVRVRVHQNLARIEVLPDEMERLFLQRADVHSYFRRLGFDFVTLDLYGFKSGSMNVL